MNRFGFCALDLIALAALVAVVFCYSILFRRVRHVRRNLQDKLSRSYVDKIRIDS